MLTLYHYDHCPYCVKARMIFGLKDVPFQLKPLLYDDEETPRSFIGAKMLPILQTEKKYMPESLDIIRYIDESFQKPVVDWRESDDLQEWLKKCGSLHYFLAMPRWVKAPLEEFKTPQAQEYFQEKKEGYTGPFETALKETDKFLTQLAPRLKELEDLLPENGPFFKKGRLSVNDFHLFAYLRSLSVVRDISFPEKVKSYMDTLSQKSKTPLHYSIAV